MIRFRSSACGHLPGRATSSSSFISQSGVSAPVRRDRSRPRRTHTQRIAWASFSPGRGKPCQRSTPFGDDSCRMQRLSGRTFWLLWATIMLISAAFYYEKAADQPKCVRALAAAGTAIRVGREHLRQDALPQSADHADLAVSADGVADGGRRDVLVWDQGRDDDRGPLDVLSRLSSRRAGGFRRCFAR